MKRRIKIKPILILIFIIFLIFSIIYLLTNNDKNKLKHIGYNIIEANEILKLSETEINKILKYDYNKNLIYIIQSDKYKKEKLDLYLEYTTDNNLNYLDIFNTINDSDFNKKNIDKYIKLLKKYKYSKGLISFVNNYYNQNITPNDTVFSLIEKKYFIIDYLDRYLNYYENHKELSLDEIITRINSNLDYEFYTNSSEADISKGMYTLVNKYNYLKQDFVPNDLVQVSFEHSIQNTKLNKIALENFIHMFNEAKKENLIFKITTAYRDYNFQSTLYNNYVKLDGVKNADTYSARPGYSEHQLGYSIDLTTANYSNFDKFENTNEYEWLKNNAHKYGFILRYPKNKEYITGYQFESWHYRYVGAEIATYIYENNITYEEYYAYYLR